MNMASVGVLTSQDDYREYGMRNNTQESFDEEFTQAILKEAKRRGLVANAACQYCGWKFIKQELATILAHKAECTGR